MCMWAPAHRRKEANADRQSILIYVCMYICTYMTYTYIYIYIYRYMCNELSIIIHLHVHRCKPKDAQTCHLYICT